MIHHQPELSWSTSTWLSIEKINTLNHVSQYKTTVHRSRNDLRGFSSASANKLPEKRIEPARIHKVACLRHEMPRQVPHTGTRRTGNSFSCRRNATQACEVSPNRPGIVVVQSGLWERCIMGTSHGFVLPIGQPCCQSFCSLRLDTVVQNILEPLAKHKKRKFVTSL